MLCFEVDKSQLAVIKQTLETASLMLCREKVRGHSLEMICADFVARLELTPRVSAKQCQRRKAPAAIA